MSKPKKLEGKVTIITGGAQGIGRTTVEMFTNEGAKVVIWDINEDKGREAIEEFKSIGLDVEFSCVDTTKFPYVDEAARNLYQRYKKIDILINNAGITRDATLLNMTLDQWQQVIDVNLTGVFNCTKAVAPFMLENKYGRIINTSSLVGIYGNFGQTNYAATKSGVVGITKVWARELSKHGITVNAVAPGFIETETLKTIPDKVIKSIQEKIPVGRLGKPEDIANAYLFLASDEAAYISGSVLSVDGGYIA
ncbi:MAG: 3-oxoacyl-ACP reductase FabG [Cytophagaceae bacterium]|nr:3-oxoacyl-ACP reductase FabG [Cytophagaceae bacterium]